MSVALPQRGVLTDTIVRQLTGVLAAAEPAILVGDAIKPQGGGWGAQPGVTDYTPYVTIGTGKAQLVSAEPDTLASQHTAWNCLYTLSSFGGARAQADYIADAARAALVTVKDLSPISMYAESWSVLSVLFTQMGSIDRNDATDPPFWQLLDAAVVRISRESRRT